MIKKAIKVYHIVLRTISGSTNRSAIQTVTPTKPHWETLSKSNSPQVNQNSVVFPINNTTKRNYRYKTKKSVHDGYFNKPTQ